MNRLRRFKPRTWTNVANEAIDNLPDLLAVGLLAQMLRYPDDYRLDMDSLAKRKPGNSRKGLYAAMKLLVTYGYVVKVKFQVERGRWATETLLFEEPCTAEELGQIAEMYRPGSRVESWRGTERVDPEHALEPVDRPAESGRSVRPAKTPENPSSHRPAGRRQAGDRQVGNRQVLQKTDTNDGLLPPPSPPDTTGEPDRAAEPETGEEGEDVSAFWKNVPGSFRPSVAKRRPIADEVRRLLATRTPEALASELMAQKPTDRPVRHPVPWVLKVLPALPDEPPQAPQKAKTALPPVCGQCEARDGDPVSARIIFDEDTGTSKCPRCHPHAKNTEDRDG